jgi:hypothetical protein
MDESVVVLEEREEDMVAVSTSETGGKRRFANCSFRCSIDEGFIGGVF